MNVNIYFFLNNYLYLSEGLNSWGGGRQISFTPPKSAKRGSEISAPVRGSTRPLFILHISHNGNMIWNVIDYGTLEKVNIPSLWEIDVNTLFGAHLNASPPRKLPTAVLALEFLKLRECDAEHWIKETRIKAGFADSLVRGSKGGQVPGDVIPLMGCLCQSATESIRWWSFSLFNIYYIGARPSWCDEPGRLQHT